MYNEYFGFKEAPFSIAPDPRYLYMTAQHREALAHLVYGLNSEGGCILLTGEVGTGKTTICRCLLEQIPDQANVALVLNPKLSEIELLETICDELKISYPDSDNSVKTYTDRIYEFLIKSNRNNEKTVLIIDEAQNLDSKVLEQLRLLTNLETHQRKLLQIIIIGQPELLDILAKSEMRQLAQRITARFHLRPLTKSEVKTYVSHRLAIAGQHIQLFPENSLKLLYKLSNGIPRLINIICDRALLGAYVENQYAVSPAIIKKAATEVFGELKNVEKYHKNKRWLYPLSAFSGITIIAITLFFYFSYTEEKDLASSQPVTSSDIKNEQLSLISEDATNVLSGTKAVEQSAETQNKSAEKSAYQAKSDAADSLGMTEKQQAEIQPAVIQQTENEAETTVDINYDNISEVLNGTTNNPASSYQELFKIWNQYYDTKTLMTACEQAETYSLSCLHTQGNLKSLKQHNRPAILTLINNQGETRYLTIASIHNNHATVFSNNTAHTIRLSDLDKYWHGKFVILWRKPGHYLSAITPGHSGKIVSWINEKLSIINNNTISETVKNTYDDELADKVKAFQLQHGLIADAIVGPVTILHLNTQSGINVPSLTKKG
jgi:general secretion pathway protein A